MSSGQLAGTACAEHAPSASRASHFEQPVFGLQCRHRLQAASLQRAAVRLPVRAARAIAECRWLAGATQSLLPSLALASAVPPRHQHSRPAPKHAAGVSSEAAKAPPHNDPTPRPNLCQCCVCVGGARTRRSSSLPLRPGIPHGMSARGQYIICCWPQSLSRGGRRGAGVLLHGNSKKMAGNGDP